MTDMRDEFRMIPRWAACSTSRLLVVAVFLLTLASSTEAQVRRLFEESLVNEVDEANLTDLAKIEELINAGQLPRVIELLQRMIETPTNQVVRGEKQLIGGTEFTRFLPLDKHCQLSLCRLARNHSDLLDLYRRRVDLKAAALWNRPNPDSASEGPGFEVCRKIARELICSSYGAKALSRLGEFHMQRGDFAKARVCWERIDPKTRTWAPPDRSGVLNCSWPLWLSFKGLETKQYSRKMNQLRTSRETTAVDEFTCPPVEIEFADVVARLAYLSIVQQDDDRADVEVELMRQVFGDASGPFFGTSTNFAQRLNQELKSSASWSIPEGQEGWPNLSGNLQRNGSARFTQDFDISSNPVWTVTVPRRLAPLDEVAKMRPRVSEDSDGLLSYHPIVLDDFVFWSEMNRVRCVRLANGQPGWPLGDEVDSDPLQAGVIWQDDRGLGSQLGQRGHVGVPRFTASSKDEMLFARLGSPITSPRRDLRNRGYLVGLDLTRQGRLLSGFPLEPDEKGWEFDGTPLSDGNHLYVALRRTSTNSARTELHLAAYPLTLARNAKQLESVWRVKICESDTPSSGQWDEVTHMLLSISEGTVYCNSNMGIIAAVSAADGQIEWLTQYERKPLQSSDPDDINLHFFRDLNPCMIHRGIAYVAPTDSEAVFAIDARRGSILWSQLLPDVSHLVGIGDGNLILGGHHLYWLDANTGYFRGQFPIPGVLTADGFSIPSPRGIGRGTCSEHLVFWPTRETIFVFDKKTQKVQMADGRDSYEPIPVDRIELVPRGITGGNLILTRNVLLLAGKDQITAFAISHGETAEKVQR